MRNVDNINIIIQLLRYMGVKLSLLL